MAGWPWLASLTVVLWWWVAVAQAEVPVVLSSAEFAPIDLGPHCDVLQDAAHSDTLDNFSSMVAQENFLFSGFFGVMLGLAVSALLLYAVTGYPVFAAYCAYTIAFTMMVAAINGYGMQYLWPASPLAQQVLPTVFTAASILTGILFIRRFIAAPLARVNSRRTIGNCPNLLRATA